MAFHRAKFKKNICRSNNGHFDRAFNSRFRTIRFFLWKNISPEQSHGETTTTLSYNFCTGKAILKKPLPA
ncbi:MAG: hypothetical protein CSA31_00765 [Desulfobulbus propionicus]|nr:MAG: hypothetical protein CSA31_00765 [Desulfobulbus propionicus]